MFEKNGTCTWKNVENFELKVYKITEKDNYDYEDSIIYTKYLFMKFIFNCQFFVTFPWRPSLFIINCFLQFTVTKYPRMAVFRCSRRKFRVLVYHCSILFIDICNETLFVGIFYQKHNGFLFVFWHWKKLKHWRSFSIYAVNEQWLLGCKPRPRRT